MRTDQGPLTRRFAVVIAIGSLLYAGQALGLAGKPASTRVVSTAAASVNLGLMMRNGQAPSSTLTAYVHGYIIPARWNAIQPTSSASFVTTQIDKEVAAVRAWNIANPTNPRGLRLRITAGWDTPSWALNLGGTSVRICDPQGRCGNVPRWWTAPVQAAYKAFVDKLAAYVNPIPEIREVTEGLTVTEFGEIMVRHPKTGNNAAAYAAGGFSEALDVAAMKVEVDDAQAFTAIDQMDVADYESPTGQDITVSKEIMDYAVLTQPGRVQFANANITQDPTHNAAILALMKTYGPLGNNTATITFQTYPQLTSVSQTLQNAVSLGACSVELPPGTIDPAVVGPYDAMLRANCLA
jgi:hypothetical protein